MSRTRGRPLGRDERGLPSALLSPAVQLFDLLQDLVDLLFEFIPNLLIESS